MPTPADGALGDDSKETAMDRITAGTLDPAFGAREARYL
jgi:hypothetical protein